MYETDYESKFDAWIKLTPTNYQPYLARAKYYYSLGWKFRGGKFSDKTKKSQFSAMRRYFEKAKLDIEKALTINKSSMVAYSMLIGIAQSSAHSVEAQSIIKKALQINPSSFLVREHYINSLQPRWGGSYIKMQQFADEAQAFSSNNIKLEQLKGYAILDAAKIQYSEKNYGEAENLFNTALLYGENSLMLFARGKNFYRQQKYELALQDYNQAISLDPNYADFYYWRSLLFTKINRFQSGLTDIQKAAALDPKDDFIQKRHQRLLAQIQPHNIQRESTENLEPEFDKIIALINQDPNNASLYFKKAKLFLQKNNPLRASIDLKKAVELAPEEFEYYSFLDIALFKLNRLDEIIQFWNAYLKLKPNDSRAYLERSGTYYHQQEFSLALQDAEKAFALGNKDAERSYINLKAMLDNQ